MDDSAIGRRGVDPAPGLSFRHRVVAVENARGAGPVVVVCDHASNHVPGRLRDLGLRKDDLQRHIAWDPGAVGVSRELARRLDAPLVASCVSRLVIDCNRDPSAVDSIPEISEETVVPGNAAIEAGTGTGGSMRSMSRSMRRWTRSLPRRSGQVRSRSSPCILSRRSTKAASAPGTWASCTIATRAFRGPCWRRCRRSPASSWAPMSRIVRMTSLSTLDRHAQARGFPSLMIEIRNDLVATPEAESLWGDKLGKAIQGALKAALDTEPDTPAA